MCGRREKEKTTRGQIWQQQQTRGGCGRHVCAPLPNAKCESKLGVWANACVKKNGWMKYAVGGGARLC